MEWITIEQNNLQTIADQIKAISGQSDLAFPAGFCQALENAAPAVDMSEAIAILEGTVEDIVIPDGVTSLDFNRLLGCGYLSTITVPSSVESIRASGSGWLGGPSEVTWIVPRESYAQTWADGNEYPWVYDDATDAEAIVSGTVANSIWSLDKRTGVLTLSQDPHYNNITDWNQDMSFSSSNRPPWYDYRPYIRSVTISGTYSGFSGSFSGAFDDHFNLKSLVWPDGLNRVAVPCNACTKLRDITVPSTLIGYGLNAFPAQSKAYQRRNIYISDLSSWARSGGGTGNITSNVHTTIYLNNTKITSLTIPDDVTSIGSYAFCGCSGITSLTIPNGVTDLWVEAFRGCSGLTSLIIPSSITDLWAGTFVDCSSLTSVTFRGSPSHIAYNAFDGCDALVELNVPWSEGDIANAPWGASNAAINYNFNE